MLCIKCKRVPMNEMIHLIDVLTPICYFTTVKCPVGTFFNVVSKSCSGCPLGTYQPLEGSVACLVCPVNHTTDHNNSKSEQECKGQTITHITARDWVQRHSVF